MKSTIQRFVALTAVLLGAAAVAQEPKPRLVLKGDTETIHSAVFSANGTVLATRNWKGLVTVWNAATGKPMSVIKNHLSGFGVALSPDAKLVYTGGDDKLIKVWDAKSGKELRKLQADFGVSQLALSPDGKLLASGHAKSGDVVLWNTATGKQLHTHKVSDNLARVLVLVFSPDGKLLAAGNSRDQDNLIVLDTAEGKEIAKFRAAGGEVPTLAFSPDGKVLAAPTSSFGGKAPIKLWDTATWKEASSVEGTKVTTHRLAFSKDGSTLYAHDSAHVLKAWDVASKAEKAGFTVRGSILVASPDGKTLAAGGLPKGAGTPAELFLFGLPLP